MIDRPGCCFSRRKSQKSILSSVGFQRAAAWRRRVGGPAYLLNTIIIGIVIALLVSTLAAALNEFIRTEGQAQSSIIDNYGYGYSQQAVTSA